MNMYVNMHQSRHVTEKKHKMFSGEEHNPSPDPSPPSSPRITLAIHLHSVTVLGASNVVYVEKNTASLDHSVQTG